MTTAFTPAHGWFAIGAGNTFLSIALRDFGITQYLDSYVGLVDDDWFVRSCEKLDHGIHEAGEVGLPPKIRFNREFLGYLNSYMLPLHKEVTPRGNLKWYMTVQIQTGDRFDWFVNCEMNGKRYVWQLIPESEESSDTTILGVWRD